MSYDIEFATIMFCCMAWVPFSLTCSFLFLISKRGRDLNSRSHDIPASLQSRVLQLIHFHITGKQEEY